MKQIKVSEATNIQLNWLVAKCEGWDAPICKNPTWGVPTYLATNDTGLYTYNPTTNWSQGGPIIERERLIVRPYYTGEWECAASPSVWQSGPTPLIAAMRCFVASKLGEAVEVPEELT